MKLIMVRTQSNLFKCYFKKFCPSSWFNVGISSGYRVTLNCNTQGFLLHPSTNIDLPLKNERILDWESGDQGQSCGCSRAR